MLNDNEQLVKRAAAGDAEAFGLLVRRHHAAAFGWASLYTDDAHMAEDIVQDAYMRAYERLEQLREASRFSGWLRQIVRNEARARMRRSSRASRELSTFGGVIPETAFGTDEPFRSGGGEGDPLERLLQGEFCRMFTMLTESAPISSRDFRIFVDFWEEGGEPRELASRYGLTPANVYKILMRTRDRLAEAYRMHQLKSDIEGRRRRGKPQRGSLQIDFGFFEEFWDSAILGLAYMIRVRTGGDVSLTELMGVSGHAFRLSVEPEEIGIAGPNGYRWRESLRRALEPLGCTAACEGGPDDRNADTPVRMLALVRRSIDAGIPALCWDVGPPLFSVATGYDDRRGEVATIGFGGHRTITYRELCGRGTPVFAMTVAETRHGLSARLHRRGLAAALRNAEQCGSGDADRLPPFVHGLEAYDCWIEALRAGRADPYGHAYNTACFADARRHAAAFLRGLEEHATIGTGPFAADGADSEIAGLFGQAAACYGGVRDALYAVRRRFPFPNGGSMSPGDALDEAIERLAEAQRQEREGLLLLTRARERLEGEAPAP
jgi:RNA polymerase sigma factor (sigma-70 family)